MESLKYKSLQFEDYDTEMENIKKFKKLKIYILITFLIASLSLCLCFYIIFGDVSSLESKVESLYNDHELTKSNLGKLQVDLEKTNEELSKTQIGLLETQDDLLKTQDDLLKTQGDLSKTQGDLSKTQEDLLKTQGDLSKTQDDLLKTQEDLSETQTDLLKTQFDVLKMQNQLNNLEKQIQETNALLIGLTTKVSQEINICQINCLNGGQPNVECNKCEKCSSDWTGDYCEIPLSCDSICSIDASRCSCLNGGTLNSQLCQCDCPPAFIGDNCQEFDGNVTEEERHNYLKDLANNSTQEYQALFIDNEHYFASDLGWTMNFITKKIANAQAFRPIYPNNGTLFIDPNGYKHLITSGIEFKYLPGSVVFPEISMKEYDGYKDYLKRSVYQVGNEVIELGGFSDLELNGILFSKEASDDDNILMVEREYKTLYSVKIKNGWTDYQMNSYFKSALNYILSLPYPEFKSDWFVFFDDWGMGFIHSAEIGGIKETHRDKKLGSSFSLPITQEVRCKGGIQGCNQTESFLWSNRAYTKVKVSRLTDWVLDESKKPMMDQAITDYTNMIANEEMNKLTSCPDSCGMGKCENGKCVCNDIFTTGRTCNTCTNNIISIKPNTSGVGSCSSPWIETLQNSGSGSKEVSLTSISNTVCFLNRIRHHDPDDDHHSRECQIKIKNGVWYLFHDTNQAMGNNFCSSYCFYV